MRDFGAGDAASIARHADDRRVWRNLLDRFPHPYTVADAEQWLAHVAAQDPGTDFAIEIDGEAAGGIGLTPGQDVHRRSAHIGFWLGRAHWGKGIASELVPAVTEWAFAHLDLCRIHAEVFEWNAASMRVLEKAGYEREGRLRRAAVKDGETIDLLVYAIVRE